MSFAEFSTVNGFKGFYNQDFYFLQRPKKRLRKPRNRNCALNLFFRNMINKSRGFLSQDTKKTLYLTSRYIRIYSLPNHIFKTQFLCCKASRILFPRVSLIWLCRFSFFYTSKFVIKTLFGERQIIVGKIPLLLHYSNIVRLSRLKILDGHFVDVVYFSPYYLVYSKNNADAN